MADQMTIYKIKLVSQKTEKTCWEACARMMWLWRKGSLTGYPTAAGSYQNLDDGLDDTQSLIFYSLSLGMQHYKSPKGANLRHALKWTPVIIMDRNKKLGLKGHVMVACGYDPKKHQYLVANPQQLEQISFDDADPSKDTVKSTAGLKWHPEKGVDSALDTYMFYW